MVVAATAEKADFRSGMRILRRQLMHVLRQLQLAERRWHVQRSVQTQSFWNALEQLVERIGADRVPALPAGPLAY